MSYIFPFERGSEYFHVFLASRKRRLIRLRQVDSRSKHFIKQYMESKPKVADSA